MLIKTFISVWNITQHRNNRRIAQCFLIDNLLSRSSCVVLPTRKGPAWPLELDLVFQNYLFYHPHLFGHLMTIKMFPTWRRDGQCSKSKMEALWSCPEETWFDPQYRGERFGVWWAGTRNEWKGWPQIWLLGDLKTRIMFICGLEVTGNCLLPLTHSLYKELLRSHILVSENDIFPFLVSGVSPLLSVLSAC